MKGDEFKSRNGWKIDFLKKERLGEEIFLSLISQRKNCLHEKIQIKFYKIKQF